MATETRWSSADKFRVKGAMSALSDELSAALGTKCYATRSDVEDANHPGESMLTIESSIALNDNDLDAALAAFPTATPASGTLDVAAGNDYLISFPIAVDPGESIALDIHVHAAFGVADDFEPKQFDYYACVYRRTAGNVRATDPTGINTGKIPSLGIKIVCDSQFAWVYATQRATGKLTIIDGEVIITSRGTVPP